MDGPLADGPAPFLVCLITILVSSLDISGQLLWHDVVLAEKPVPALSFTNFEFMLITFVWQILSTDFLSAEADDKTISFLYPI